MQILEINILVLNFYVFYMFPTRRFIFRKTVVYTAVFLKMNTGGSKYVENIKIKIQIQKICIFWFILYKYITIKKGKGLSMQHKWDRRKFLTEFWCGERNKMQRPVCLEFMVSQVAVGGVFITLLRLIYSKYLFNQHFIAYCNSGHLKKNTSFHS